MTDYLISRQATLDILEKEGHKWGNDYRDWVDAIEEIKKLQPVNPQEPKTGHWIRWYERKENNGYTENIPHCKCSECNTEYDSHTSQFIKYCNECGAKMFEPQESEE